MYLSFRTGLFILFPDISGLSLNKGMKIASTLSFCLKYSVSDTIIPSGMRSFAIAILKFTGYLNLF